MDKRTIDIILRARDEASATLKGVRGEMDKVGNAAKAGLGQAVQGGAILGGVAIAGLGAAIGASIANINEAQAASAQLDAVLKSTGGAAGVSAQQIKDHASALALVTTFGDDAIVAGNNLLLTFTNIKGPIMQQATETMLDMSAALGQDTKASAIQLGKALNDPIMGVTALRKVGVSFTESQQDQIRTLVESGKMMDAQKLILKELGTEFGGSARAQAQTFGGQLKVLQNQFGEILETVGLFVVNALQPLVAWAAKAAGAIDWEGVMAGLQRGLQTAYEKVVQFLDPVIKFVSEHSEAFIGALQKAAIAGAGLAVIGIAIAIATSPITAFVAAALLIGAAIQGIMMLVERFRPQLLEVWAAVQPYIEIVKTQLMQVWSMIVTQLVPAIQQWWATIGPMLIPVLQVLGVILGVVIFGAIMIVVNVVKLLIGIWVWLLNTGVSVVNGIMGAFSTMVNGIMWVKNNFWESIGFIIGFFATLPIKIPLLVAQALWGAINFLRSIDWWGLFIGILNAVGNIMGRVKDAFMGAFNFFRGIDWGAAFANVGRSIGNALIGMIEGAINGALKGIPTSPTVRLPRFAGGGIMGGGAALTGEQGREIIMAPRGTEVVRNSTTEQVLARLGGGSGPQINVTVPVSHGTPSERQEYAVSIAAEILNAMRAQGVTDMGALRG